MKKSANLLNILILSILLTILTHCARWRELNTHRVERTSDYSGITQIPSERNSTFTAITNIEKIKIGLKPSDIVDIFGEPDFKFETTIGKDINKAKQALIFEYAIVRNMLYEKLYVNDVNTFVFVNEMNSYKLVRWDLQDHVKVQLKFE